MRKIYNNEELSRIVDRLSETVNSRMDITANNSSGTAYINMRTVSTPPRSTQLNQAMMLQQHSITGFIVTAMLKCGEGFKHAH